MKQILLLALITVYTGCSTVLKDDDWAPVTRQSKPWTRWWWLGSAVDSANLTYNLEALSRAGIGGVEITPIYGLRGGEAQYIDYLSPRWMKMLAFTEKEAARLGMGVDMNNGTGWPFGGLTVGEEDAAKKAVWKQLSVEIANTRQKVKRAAPGGQGLVVDHFNKAAVERYLARFDSAFAVSGTPYPNSFFNDSYEVYGADWTPTLLNEFERKRGYRLQDYFDELLNDGATDTSARVISDYRETIGDLLHDNFTRTWTDWAHSHGATVRNQAHGSPANLLDLYALVDIPECEIFGITDFDIPGLRKDSIFKSNDGDPTVLKYASSAAHITGKRYTSAETFTWLTDHFRTSLSQCKPEIDLMFASGVNHVFFHGTAYSPREAEWPGWKFYAAVDMSPTNSIWRDAPPFFDYIARTQAFLQSGQPDADFLLYLPIDDIRHYVRGNYYLPFAIHDMRKRVPEFCAAVEEILAEGFDCDYISDRFLQTCTVTPDKQILTQGGAIYKALLMPSVKRLPVETMRKIADLMQQGVNVLFIGYLPDDVPGLHRLDERRKEFGILMTKISDNINLCKSVKSALSAYQNEPFIADFGGNLIRRKHGRKHGRKHEAGHIYFLTMLKNNTIDGWVRLGTEARSAVFFNPMTGEKGKARINGNNEVYLQLKPGQSIILKTFVNQDINTKEWNYYQSTGAITELKNGWKLHFIESYPAVNQQYQIANLVSWTDIPNDTMKRNMGTACYSTTFEIVKQPFGEYRLTLGDVRESARVRINGREVATLYAVPFEINIGKYLKNGVNTLDIEVTNLPANRIADLDRNGVNWRNFNDINVVNVYYKTDKYDTWDIVPSGLLGPVIIEELKPISNQILQQ
ncbi:MAG: glycosyl hydrolase family 2 [Tannerella sp.]|jgi:hypothetical protein|nr:glycosyl hydrolase family 2 [Tannerella sp.]